MNAADLALEVTIAWERIKREGEAHLAALGGSGIVEFTPSKGGQCATCGTPLRYATDWRAPWCVACDLPPIKEQG